MAQPAGTAKENRRGSSVSSDLLFGLFPLIFMAVYFYGLRPAVMVVFALITARLCDVIVARLRGLKDDPSENSSLFYAAAFTLLLPATAPYYVVLIGTAVGLLVGKHAFGGAGCEVFHPSALCYVIAAVCWPKQVSLYPVPFTKIGIFDTSAAVMQESSASILKSGAVPDIPSLELILGNYAGPMGATFCLVIGACAIYLLIRRRITPDIPLACLGVCALISYFTKLIPSVSGLELVKYELLSGAVVYASVFLVCDAVTSPKNRLARILFGMLVGFLTMMYRFYGYYELGFCFAILFADAFSGFFDRLCSRIPHRKQVKNG